MMLRRQSDWRASSVLQSCRQLSSWPEPRLSDEELPAAPAGGCALPCTGAHAKLAARWHAAAQSPAIEPGCPNGPDAPWLTNGPPLPYRPLKSVVAPATAAKGPEEPCATNGPPGSPLVVVVC